MVLVNCDNLSGNRMDFVELFDGMQVTDRPGVSHCYTDGISRRTSLPLSTYNDLTRAHPSTPPTEDGCSIWGQERYVQGYMQPTISNALPHSPKWGQEKAQNLTVTCGY